MNLANLEWWGWFMLWASLVLFLDDVVEAWAYVHGTLKSRPLFGASVAGLLAVLYIVGTP